MLVDETIVGPNCENFKFTYEEGMNSKGVLYLKACLNC